MMLVAVKAPLLMSNSDLSRSVSKSGYINDVVYRKKDTKHQWDENLVTLSALLPDLSVQYLRLRCHTAVKPTDR